MRVITAILITLFLSIPAYGATISLTVDNTKAEEYVDYYSGDTSMTSQQKLDWLKTHILSILRENFKSMRNSKTEVTNNSANSTESETAFSN